MGVGWLRRWWHSLSFLVLSNERKNRVFGSGVWILALAMRGRSFVHYSLAWIS